MKRRKQRSQSYGVCTIIQPSSDWQPTLTCIILNIMILVSHNSKPDSSPRNTCMNCTCIIHAQQNKHNSHNSSNNNNRIIGNKWHTYKCHLKVTTSQSCALNANNYGNVQRRMCKIIGKPHAFKKMQILGWSISPAAVQWRVFAHLVKTAT